MSCKHCKEIEEWTNHLAVSPDEMTNREYWLLTELFVYLHNGKDYCNFNSTTHFIKAEEIINELAKIEDIYTTNLQDLARLITKSQEYKNQT